MVCEAMYVQFLTLFLACTFNTRILAPLEAFKKQFIFPNFEDF